MCCSNNVSLYYRMESYNCITDTLAYLLSASVSHPHAPSVPKSPGPPPQPDPNRMTTYDAEKHVRFVQLKLQILSSFTCTIHVHVCYVTFLCVLISFSFTWQKEDVFRMSLKSDDEMFHVALYDWFFNASLTEKLLEVHLQYH